MSLTPFILRPRHPGQARRAGGHAAKEGYDNSRRYHRPGDEWSAKWDLSGLVQDATVYYQIGNEPAHSRQWPVWRDTSDFKAARDPSAAERK